MLSNIKQLFLKEGHSKILWVLGVTILLFLIGFSFFAKIGLGLFFVLMWIYRAKNDLYRPSFLPNTLYAPIDGKVLSIDSQKEKHKVTIEVGLFGDHSLYAPIDATLLGFKTIKGLNLSSANFKSKSLNNQASFEMQTADRTHFGVTLVAGILAPSIVIDSSVVNAKAGDPLGVFVNGIVIITIPKSYNIQAKIGDRLQSCASVVAGKIE